MACALAPKAQLQSELATPLMALLEDMGVSLIEDAGLDFGAEFRHCDAYLGLRSLGSDPFAVLAPGTIVLGDFAPDLGPYFASKDFVPVWPVELLYGPKRPDIWTTLFESQKVDVASMTHNSDHPAIWSHWPEVDGRIVLGPDAESFGRSFAHFARVLLDEPPSIVATQNARKNLLRIALPLALAEQGANQTNLGRPDTLLPNIFVMHRLAYFYSAAPIEAVDRLETAVSANKVKKVLKLYEPAKRLIYQGKGRQLRERFYSEAGQRPRDLMRRLRKNTKWWVR